MKVWIVGRDNIIEGVFCGGNEADYFARKICAEENGDPEKDNYEEYGYWCEEWDVQ